MLAVTIIWGANNVAVKHMLLKFSPLSFNAAVLASAGCRPPLLTPQALDPDLVPEDVRESLERTPDVSNIV